VKRLEIVHQPDNEMGWVRPCCLVNHRSGKSIILANTYEEVSDAVAANEVFEGAEVVGMKPMSVTINPVYVESVQVLR